MSKKKKMQPIVIDAMTVWQTQKPRYNGYQTGHGVHGDTKYNRRKEKKKFEREEW